ncbi:hypothetical protein [Leptolyngbya sp. NK1-12]|uniref:hypothetical protein n=1 Tax=Leptolyngbya sp. NK1-12 TaxID=2547451 RepID=UPI00292FFBCC|nr:hypothetical protein [Leptolyngbya sp. NK1-12]
MQQQTGQMGLLHLPTLLRDEGLIDTLKIGWNVLTRPVIRQRVWGMRRVFQQHQSDLGYIVLMARKEG